MPREKWLVDPGELDEFQREIRTLSINDSYIIKGCAGSGKTVLALYHANDIRIHAIAEDENAQPSFTLVIYTKALRAFIRSGVQDLGINLDQVVHYALWNRNQVDYIIVDEAQDFRREEIDSFMASKRKAIMFYGDTQQQLYENRLSIEEIERHLGLPHRELLKNYRLPKPIASFSEHLGHEVGLENKCVKGGTDKPKLRKFRNWEGELDFIMSEIQTRNYTDVAILLPFNTRERAQRRNGHRNVQAVKEYFDSKGFRHQFKIRDDDNDAMDLDFDTDLPKVMTYHSSKGLQFETVFIPYCDIPDHDQWLIDRYSNPFYVASTRTYRDLYLSYSTRLTPFFDGIPTTKYDLSVV